MTSVILLRSYACWFLSTIIRFAFAQNGDVITLPPAIIQQPNQFDSHFFTQRTSITVMPCVATGFPSVSFQWQRNGVVVPPVPIPADRPSGSGAFYNDKPNIVGGIFNGTMVVYGTGDSLLGAYQCFASLTIAPQVRAMSDIAYVHEQYFTPFPAPSLTLTTKSVAAGEYVQLVCAALVMSPMPLVTWELKDQPKAPLIDNQRIVLDDKGTLHILSAAPKGYEFSGQLQCIQHNSEVNAYARGQPTVLTLDTSVNMGYRAPKVVYVSDSPKYILAGDWDGTDEQLMSHTAYCIFSANPAPRVQWTRADGAALGTGIVAKGPLLWFRNAVVADSGSYVCTAVNTNGNVDSAPVTQQIRVEVRSKPVLIQNVSTLVNRTVGEDVVIDCGAGGSPSPSYKWYINSIPERDYTVDISNRVIEGGRLTIYRLGKPEDMSLITCNASNAAGSVMRTVGIKVYNKTSIVSYTPVVYANATDSVVLTCSADADSSLPIDVYWTRKGSSTRIVTAPERQVFVSMGDRGKIARVALELARMNESELQYWAYGPDYECVASTPIAGGTERVTTKLQLQEIATTQTPAANYTEALPIIAEVQAAGFELWMIGIIVGFVLLIALIIGIVCAVRRQRGGSYKVDAKERAQGNDPLKELRRDGFADYVRPDQDPSKSIRPALEDVENGISVASDDEDSMGEYGHADTARFDEDGSFIGQYGAAERANNKNHASVKPASNEDPDMARDDIYRPPSYVPNDTPKSALRTSAVAPRPGMMTYPTYDIEKAPLLEMGSATTPDAAREDRRSIDTATAVV